MNKTIIFIGFCFIVLGFLWLLPELILKKLGLPITGETDLSRITVNAVANVTDIPAGHNVADKINEAFDIIDATPWILIITGLFMISVCIVYDLVTKSF